MRLSIHGNFLVERGRGLGRLRLAAGFRQFLAQLVDLFGQRLVLLFQAVEAFHDLSKIGLPEIRATPFGPPSGRRGCPAPTESAARAWRGYGERSADIASRSCSSLSRTWAGE